MPTLAEIEETLERRLSGLIIDTAGSGVAPSLYIEVSGGSLERVTSIKYRIRATFDIIIVFKDITGERIRRKGLYPFLEAVILSILDQDLGLDITPISPGSFSEVTNDDLSAGGFIAYSVKATTSYTLAKVEEEDLRNLMTVSLSYLLSERDDETVDASDTVSLPLLPKG